MARGALLLTVGVGLGLLVSDVAQEREAPAAAAVAAPAPIPPAAAPSEPPALLVATPSAATPRTAAPPAAYMVRPVPALAVSRSRQVPDPARVTIASLGIDRDLVELGITDDGRLAAPTNRTDIGWWSTGPAPGESGAVVVAAHVSLDGEPAVFAGLSQVQPGEDVVLTRADGSTATYRVSSVEQFAKTDFPDERVYSVEGPNRLRLITCGGQVDPQTRHFVDNVVVFADLQADTLAPADL